MKSKWPANVPGAVLDTPYGRIYASIVLGSRIYVTTRHRGCGLRVHGRDREVGEEIAWTDHGWDFEFHPGVPLKVQRAIIAAM
jgi:hypothetical protein